MFQMCYVAFDLKSLCYFNSNTFPILQLVILFHSFDKFDENTQTHSLHTRIFLCYRTALEWIKTLFYHQLEESQDLFIYQIPLTCNFYFNPAFGILNEITLFLSNPVSKFLCQPSSRTLGFLCFPRILTLASLAKYLFCN